MCDPGTGNCVPNPAKTNCADKCKRCNPNSGVCDLPTATANGCSGCEFCDSASGQCKTDTAKFTNCINSNKCSTCDPANGQCKLDPVKTTCANKCKVTISLLFSSAQVFTLVFLGLQSLYWQLR